MAAEAPAVGFRRVTVDQLELFCSGPNSRERVLEFLRHTSAAELLQQTASAADAVKSTEDATEAGSPIPPAVRAIQIAARAENDQNADLSQLLDLLISAVGRCFEIEELWEGVLCQKQLLPLLEAASVSPFPKIRGLLATQLKVIAQKGETGAVFLWRSSLYRFAITLLRDDETSVGVGAEIALMELARTNTGLKEIFDGRFFSQLRDMAACDKAELRIRAFSLAVHASRGSKEFFAKVRETDILDMLFNTMYSDDLLVQMTAYELLANLTTLPEGVQYLHERGLPKILTDRINKGGLEDNVVEAMLTLLACIIRELPTCSDQIFALDDKTLPRTLMRLFKSDVDDERTAAIGCWGYICNRSEGAQSLVDHMPQSISYMIGALDEKEELVHASLDALIFAFRDASVDSIPARLSQAVRTDLMPRLLGLVLGRPFAETRDRCYKLLRSLANFRGCMQFVFSSAEFRGLILDRSSESSYDARLAKHAFVYEATKHQREWLCFVLDPSFLSALDKLVYDGPFCPGSRSVGTQ